LSDEELPDEGDRARLKATRLALFLNLGVAGLKLDSFDSSLRCADQAITLDPSSAKAHFRRGQALRGLLRYADAEAALRHALSLKPKDGSIRKELVDVRDIARKEAEAAEYKENTERGMARLGLKAEGKGGGEAAMPTATATSGAGTAALDECGAETAEEKEASLPVTSIGVADVKKDCEDAGVVKVKKERSRDEKVCSTRFACLPPRAVEYIKIIWDAYVCVSVCVCV
jgi:tetratricopeptide (TPR) repeat protein